MAITLPQSSRASHALTGQRPGRVWAWRVSRRRRIAAPWSRCRESRQRGSAHLLLCGRRIVHEPRANTMRQDLLRTLLNDLNLHDDLLTWMNDRWPTAAVNAANE